MKSQANPTKKFSLYNDLKWILLGILFVAFFTSFNDKKSSRVADLPPTSYVIDRTGYTVAYDPRTRNPIYAHESLSSSTLNGRVSRDNCQFKEDTRIPEIFRSTLKDYQRSGFDRGHLAPAGDHKVSIEAMEDTFFLTNMCPQVPQMNRGCWASLEKHVRELTKQYETVEVFTGPLYLPKKDADGKRWVRYQVIGENDVAVPTHFFKVVALRKGMNDPVEIVQAYIMPNEDIPSNMHLSAFETSLDKVEKAAGMVFFSKH